VSLRGHGTNRVGRCRRTNRHLALHPGPIASGGWPHSPRVDDIVQSKW
jgi:hypothetical protein